MTTGSHRTTESCMSLVEEYRRQFEWRDWAGALSRCPVSPGQRILDLGCGAGDVSQFLASHRLNVTGVDANPELLAAARERYPACRFEWQDLRELEITMGSFDGLWCSFTAAYLVDFEATFARWSTLLKPEAWVCVIEADDLLGHEPLSAATRRRIEAFYQEASTRGRYNFRAGGSLHRALSRSGFQVGVTELADRELAFDGPAPPEILEAWRARLRRMGGLKRFLGESFDKFEAEFLTCLSAGDHRSSCRVMCCVGARG
jgi:SAM-dependent methyltransferase